MVDRKVASALVINKVEHPLNVLHEFVLDELVRLDSDFGLLSVLLLLHVDGKNLGSVASLAIDVLLIEAIADHFPLTPAYLPRFLPVLQVGKFVLRLDTPFVQGVRMESVVNTAQFLGWVVTRLIHLEFAVVDQL